MACFTPEFLIKETACSKIYKMQHSYNILKIVYLFFLFWIISLTAILRNSNKFWRPFLKEIIYEVLLITNKLVYIYICIISLLPYYERRQPEKASNVYCDWACTKTMHIYQNQQMRFQNCIQYRWQWDYISFVLNVARTKTYKPHCHINVSLFESRS